MNTPLSLYVHIPWCVRKCPYCDFNSHQAGSELPETEYVAALLEDLDADRELARGRTLQSIFFGGGTPSLLSPTAIGHILEGIQQRLALSENCEITLEANPGTIESGRFAGLRAAGVNRLSLGVQSFNDTHLQKLGRIHDSEAALQAIDAALEAGFERLNVDLMHGLPQQSPAQATEDLHRALATGVSHLSWYQLTIEPNTEFYNHPPPLPAESALESIQARGQALLQGAGLSQYEVSAYARLGQEARHNLNYWTFGDYLGIGAGAHGKVSSADGRVMRYQKTRLPKDYLARTASKTSRAQEVAAQELPFEFMMNALRLNRGFPQELFTQRTGLDWSQVADTVEALRGDGLLAFNNGRWSPTAQGRRFLDDLVAHFLPG